MAKSNKIMIQVCLCGAGTKKDKAPTVPYTADELAEQIVACAKLGACIAHIHVREDKEVDGVMQIGYKSMSLQKFTEAASIRCGAGGRGDKSAAQSPKSEESEAAEWARYSAQCRKESDSQSW